MIWIANNKILLFISNWREMDCKQQVQGFMCIDVFFIWFKMLSSVFYLDMDYTQQTQGFILYVSMLFLFV